MASKYGAADYVFQFITVTVGMFIALLINGMVEWNRDRELVADARINIQRELADNKKDLEATLSGIPADQQGMANAIRFADEMLSAKKTSINSVQLHYNIADRVSDSSWRTAERTGALALMDYEEVQRYSRVYDFQDLFMQQQRQALAQLIVASSIFKSNSDPDRLSPGDLATFRTRVMDLSALIGLQEDLGKKLIEDYTTALTP
ncbi:MAG: hypothetical protein K2Y23_02940 [Cyanobacteria bacterium]|nr:hypothetical protein [Cyanobacteriota bacterium]